MLSFVFIELFSSYCIADYVKCTVKQFECNSGQCIPAQKRCDGESDCIDAFDERIELCGK